jgi:hypothetical protein
MPVTAASKVPVAAGHLGGAQKLSAPAGSRLPLTPGMQASAPVFDQVSRTAREITRMVPV